MAFAACVAYCVGMATNLHIDPTLLQQAVALGGGKTKRETVNEALAEYVRRREAESIIAMFGTVDFDPSYNHKSERRRSTLKGLRKTGGTATPRGNGNGNGGGGGGGGGGDGKPAARPKKVRGQR